MAENVIIALEEIQIEHEQTQRRARHVRSQNRFQRPSVADAGQRVTQAQIGVLVTLAFKAPGTGVQLLHINGEGRQDIKYVLEFQSARLGKRGNPPAGTDGVQRAGRHGQRAQDVTVDKDDCSRQSKQKHDSGGEEQPLDTGGFFFYVVHAVHDLGGFGGGSIIAQLAQPAVNLFP